MWRTISLVTCLAIGLWATVTSTVASVAFAQSENTSEQIDDARLIEARDALVDADYTRAIRLCAEVLDESESAASPRARELLGLAYERIERFDDAESVYRDYLSRYPGTDGAGRVHQRVMALTTRSQQPVEDLRGPDGSGRRRAWNLSGSLAQFYRRFEIDSDLPDDGTARSYLDSRLTAAARLRESGRETALRLDGRYGHDFLGSDDGQTDVNVLLVEFRGDQRPITGALGRQIKNRDGVFGRFDGGTAGVQVRDWLKFGVNTGFVVEGDSLDRFDDDRVFAGTSVDISPGDDRWNLNLYFIEQWNDGLTDRRAIGGEIRFVDTGKSFFLLTDYDVFYSELNTLLAYASAQIPVLGSMSVTASRRTTPFLTTTNALIGQGVSSIDALQRTFTDDEIESLADDRTAIEEYASITWNRTLSERFELVGDVAISNVSDTKASGGVEEIAGTGTEWFYGIQLVAQELFGRRDVSAFGLRLRDSDDRDVASLDANIRLYLADGLLLNPKLGLDYRFGDSASADSFALRPALRSEYWWDDRHRFELELGAGWGRAWDGLDRDADSIVYSLLAGYRLAF